MFTFLEICPVKGNVFTKEKISKERGIHPRTLQVILDVLSRVERRNELREDNIVITYAQQLNTLLSGDKVKTDTLNETINKLLNRIYEISSLTSKSLVKEEMLEGINQWLVYRLVKAGLLSLKTLHTKQIFSSKHCEMKTVFVGSD